MVKRLIFVFILTGILGAAHAADNPANIRKQLMRALESREVTDSLYKSLTAVKNKTPLITGYIGAVQALKAVHVFNPFTKLKYLNQAEKTFAQAIAAEPHNIEIRFMRFSVEHNVPGFLGYGKHLEADRQEIISQLKKKNYKTADSELITTVVRFLVDSERCTPAETEYLNRHLMAML